MGVKLPDQIPWLTSHKKKAIEQTIKPSLIASESPQKWPSLDLAMKQTIKPSLIATESPQKWPSLDFNFIKWSLLSIVPWAISLKDKIKLPITLSKQLTSRARSRGSDMSTSSEPPRVRFRPYVAKVPWHTGARGFLSQLFPRYGHYCGPNWSSGKDGGSLVWDKRPIDWLDYCCYCHDIGYDTHDQEKLLEADLALLECLEKKPHTETLGDKQVAHFYKTMCVQGLRNILIPYRMHLLKLQSGMPLLQFGWLSNIKWRGWGWRNDHKSD